MKEPSLFCCGRIWNAYNYDESKGASRATQRLRSHPRPCPSFYGCGDSIIKGVGGGVDGSGSSVLDGNSENVYATAKTSLCMVEFFWGGELTCSCVTLSSQNKGSNRGCDYVPICWYDLGACDVYDDGISTL